MAAGRAKSLPLATAITPYNKFLAPSNGLESPIVLPTAIIWHPANSTTLIYQPFDERPAQLYEWVIGIPQRIQAIQAGDTEKFHLLWLTTTGALRRSQINAEGEQTLAVIPIATQGVFAFDSVPLPNRQSLIVWHTTTDFSQPIMALQVDEWGRPLGEAVEIIENAERFAVATDNLGVVHWAWVEGNTLYYRLENNEPSTWQLEITASQWIEDLVLGVSDETITLIWGIADIENPHQTHYSGLQWQTIDDIIPYGLPLSATIPVRWLEHVINDVYTVAALLNGVWRPVLIHGNQLNVLGDTPVTAAAPRVWFDADKIINAAWGTIANDGTIGVQMTSSTYTQSTLEARPKIAVGLLAGMLQLPLLVVWLVLPALMVSVWPLSHIEWSIPSVLMVYWAAKLLWPIDLLNVPLMLETANPHLWVAALLLIATCGGAAMAIWARSVRARLVWFCVGDAVLTLVIFGVNRS